MHPGGQKWVSSEVAPCRGRSYDLHSALPLLPAFSLSIGLVCSTSFVFQSRNLALQQTDLLIFATRFASWYASRLSPPPRIASVAICWSSATGRETMSKIKSYTPGWLSKPSPGHALFQASAEDLSISAFAPRRKAIPGPRRTIARRGTEVFVAVNREIRWGDLVYLKDSWAEKGGRTRIKREDTTSSFSIYDETIPSIEGADGEAAQGYRVRGNLVGCTCFGAATDNMRRLSRHPWPTRSDNSRSHQTQITLQS